MKVLITGGAGFIGSHLVERFLKENFEVRILDRTSDPKKIQHLLQDKNVEFVHGDVIDPEVCKKAVSGCDYVCHLAAMISISESVDNPQSYWEINLLGTLNMLEAARAANVKKFQYMSSCSVLGNIPANVKADENWEKLSSDSPYTASKLVGEYLCRFYNKSYGLPVVINRVFNVFGPRQEFGKGGAAVANFIVDALRGESITVFGDGEQERDWVYVKDVVDAIVLATLSDKTEGEIINISSGNSSRVKDLALKIVKLAASGKNIEIRNLPARIVDIKRSCGDNRKAKSLIGWEPRTEFQTALKETIEFYKNKIDRNG